MTASTSLHSNAFNFLSYVETGTDPRTGQYTCTISLPALKANDLCGPDVPVQLRFSPLNNTDNRDDNDVEIAYEYDSLSRVIKETVAPNTDYVASRTYTYTLAGALGDQPKSVKRPTGAEIGYVYRPELGEDPMQRIALESTAIFTYDPQNARLQSTEEVDQYDIRHTLGRTYFSTGEIKSESRGQTGEAPREMFYEYSRQARLMRYTDVLGQTQEYEYNERAQMIATRLGDTRSMFVYDDWAQLVSIETIDGSQRLKIDLEYDDFGREVLRTFDLGNDIIQTLCQTYDEVDRLVQRTLKQDTETLRDETYEYDERGRLIKYACTGSQRPVDPYGKVIDGQIFSFDAQDNLTFVETTFEGGYHLMFFEYLNEQDPCQLTGLTNEWSPELPEDPLYPPRIDFTYDADGNLLQDEVGRILDYDSLGRLISVSARPGETATDYHYDSLDTLKGLGTSDGNEQRYYKNGQLANQIHDGNSSTFVHADKLVLAEHQAGAVPKS